MGIHNIMGTQFITLRRNIVGTHDIMGPIILRHTGETLVDRG